MLWLFEEVLIDLLADKGFLDDDAAVMFDHQSGKLGPSMRTRRAFTRSA
jgi:hypothetical protein